MKLLRETIQLTGQIITPWGDAILKTSYADGIDFFTTQGKGGFRISPDRLASMPDPLNKLGTYHGVGWYEELADWSILAVSFPEVFQDDELFMAVEILLGGRRPPYFDGAELWLETPMAKPIRDRCDAFFAEHKGKFRISGINEGDGKATAFAHTIDRTRILIFEVTSRIELGPVFTREDVEQAGGVVIRDLGKGQLEPQVTPPPPPQ